MNELACGVPNCVTLLPTGELFPIKYPSKLLTRGLGLKNPFLPATCILMALTGEMQVGKNILHPKSIIIDMCIDHHHFRKVVAGFFQIDLRRLPNKLSS